MNVKELLLENQFESVWKKLGFEDFNKDYFLSIYNGLIEKNPKENVENFTLRVEKINDGDGVYYRLSGYAKGDDETYSISFVDWDEVAGYSVDLGKISKELFIYELLYEISFYGTEDEMKKVRGELEYEILNRKSESDVVKSCPSKSFLEELLVDCKEENKPDYIDFGIEGKELL